MIPQIMGNKTQKIAIIFTTWVNLTPLVFRALVQQLVLSEVVPANSGSCFCSFTTASPTLSKLCNTLHQIAETKTGEKLHPRLFFTWIKFSDLSHSIAMWTVAVAKVRTWAASGVALLQKEMLANLCPKVTLIQITLALPVFPAHTDSCDSCAQLGWRFRPCLSSQPAFL